MKIYHTRVSQKDYLSLPAEIRVTADKQLRFLADNPRHPSLRVQKIQGASRHRWEGRITRAYRFTFDWEGDTVILRRIGRHDIVEWEARP